MPKPAPSRRQLLAAIATFLTLPATRHSRAAASQPPQEARSAVLTQIRQRLVEAPVLRGEFTQQKLLKGFKNPLTSRGDFLIAKTKGVAWRTREPYPSTLVLTPERLLSRRADGSIGTQLDAEREPGLRALHQMLFALMSADLTALQQRFRIEGQLQGPERWHLTLLPSDQSLTPWLTRIDLEGDRFVRSVRLQEAQGDTSSITLGAQSTATELTPDDAARFD